MQTLVCIRRGETMTLGNKIQEIRLAKGLSQEQFGELLDTTRQTVSPAFRRVPG